MEYPKVYHAACHHLISFGGHGGDTTQGRLLCAHALRALRAKFGREQARQERYGMLFISGMFPLKTFTKLPHKGAWEELEEFEKQWEQRDHFGPQKR